MAGEAGVGKSRLVLEVAVEAGATSCPTPPRTLSLLAVASTLAAVLTVMLLLGAGNVMLEVLAETGLQRSLDDEVFVRAYGLALPAALAGIVAGSLLAAPLTALLGVTGALTALGALVAAHALMLVVYRSTSQCVAASSSRSAAAR